MRDAQASCEGVDAFVSCEERDEESNGSDEMNKIKFSYVWDKLNDPEFTTIRSWNKEKEDYYRGCIGQEFQVWKSKETYPFRPEYVICHLQLRSFGFCKTSNL